MTWKRQTDTFLASERLSLVKELITLSVSNFQSTDFKIRQLQTNITMDRTKLGLGRDMSDVTSHRRKLTTVRSWLVCRTEIMVNTNS